MTIQIAKPGNRNADPSATCRAAGSKMPRTSFCKALKSSKSSQAEIEIKRPAALERLKTFGETHRLSLVGPAIRQLRDQPRP
jgi:hypothetical protein